MANRPKKVAKPSMTRRIGIWVIAGVVVIAAGGLIAASLYGNRGAPKVYNQDPAEIRRNEIKALEKLRDEAVEDARKAGKSADEIEQLKGKFQSEIDSVSKRDDQGKGP